MRTDGLADITNLNVCNPRCAYIDMRQLIKQSVRTQHLLWRGHNGHKPDGWVFRIPYTFFTHILKQVCD